MWGMHLWIFSVNAEQLLLTWVSMPCHGHGAQAGDICITYRGLQAQHGGSQDFASPDKKKAEGL